VPRACQHGMKNEKQREREMIFARDEMGNSSFSRAPSFHFSKVILTSVGAWFDPLFEIVSLKGDSSGG
jgi:hypothetical protein